MKRSWLAAAAIAALGTLAIVAWPRTTPAVAQGATQLAQAQGGFGGGRGFGRGGGGGLQPGATGARLAASQVESHPASTNFYDPRVLRTVFLQFDQQDWERRLAEAKYADVDLPGTAVVDGVTYPDVGAQFRGASSFSRVPDGSKRSLNLSIDGVDEEQRLLGYRTLNLLNSLNDPTFVRTVLYARIAGDYIAVPKVNFVRVAINGEDWGVYLNAQQFNKDMLRETYDDNDGPRWKVPGSPRGRGGLEYLGEDPVAYKAIYEIKTKDDPAAWARLIELTRILDQTPPTRLEAALAPILDIDEALKFLALEVVLANSDGYWSRASDYNIYLDEKGRFHIIPHDFNEALRGSTTLDPLVAVDDPRKPLRSKLLSSPALRARYLGHVRQIAETWLDWGKLGPLVEQHQALIADEVAADTRKLYSTESFRSDVPNLRAWVEGRRAYLLRSAG